MAKRLGTIIFLIILAAFVPLANAAGAPEVKKIATGVYAYISTEGRTNSGFVITGEGVIVIDSQGISTQAQNLKSKI